MENDCDKFEGSEVCRMIEDLNTGQVEISSLNDKFPEIIGFLEENFQSIDSMLKSPSTDVSKLELILQDCICVIESALGLIQYISRMSSGYIQKWTEIPSAIGHILYSVFSHCKNSESLYNQRFQGIAVIIKNVFKKCQELQSSFLNLITELFEFDLDDSNESLLDVLDTVVDIGSVVITLDVKTMAEEWKGYLKLIEKYSTYLREHFNAYKPINILISELSDIIRSILSDTDTAKKIKIGGFILKVLNKTAEIFSGFLSTDLETLFWHLISIYEYRGQPELMEMVESQIIPGIELFVIKLLPDQSFKMGFRSAIESRIDESSSSCLSLHMALMKCLITVDDHTRNLWINQSDDFVFSVLFDSILSSRGVFRKDASLYQNVLITTLSLFRVCQHSNSIELKMLRVFFESDFISTLFVYDLWTLIARHESVEYRYNQMIFFIEMLTDRRNSMLLRNTVQITLISSVMSRIFSGLPEIYQSRLCEKYPIDEFPHIWSRIGLFSFPNKNIVQYASIVRRADSLLNNLMHNNVTAAEYNETIDYLELASTVDFESIDCRNETDCFKLSLISFWNNIRTLKLNLNNSESTMQGSQWFYDLTTVLCNITNNLTPFLSNQIWTTIIQTMLDLARGSQSIITVNLIGLLYNFAYHDIVRDEYSDGLVSSILNALKLISDNDSVEIYGVELFNRLLRDSPQQKIANVIKDNLKLKSRVIDYIRTRDSSADFDIVVFKHKCKLNEQFNDCDAQNEIEDSINKIRERLKTLNGLKSKLSEIHRSQLMEINSAVNELL